jgi:23S rRNA pseudouridine1911/1915/1917 synthase
VLAWLGGVVGRREIAIMLAGADLRVNGRRARKGTLLRRGDEVVIRALTLPAPPHIPDGTLSILHLDDAMVVVDKAAGVPSTIGRSRMPSVAATLLQRFPEMAALDARRAAGLVHRLDTGTSGVLVAARSGDAYRQLRAAFTRKRVTKEYLAVVRGAIDTAGVLAQPLSRHPRSRGRMVPARGVSRAWPASTAYTPLRSGSDLTLVHLRMHTGVTHQLRVHMALLGHPVVGDTRYGQPSAAADITSGLTIDAEGRTWHYLHALAIHFQGPAFASTFATPFPTHWRPLFARLGWPESVPIAFSGVDPPLRPRPGGP